MKCAQQSASADNILPVTILIVYNMNQLALRLMIVLQLYTMKGGVSQRGDTEREYC